MTSYYFPPWVSLDLQMADLSPNDKVMFGQKRNYHAKVLMQKATPQGVYSIRNLYPTHVRESYLCGAA